MKRFFSILASCAFMCTMSSVCCAKDNAPSFTVAIENVAPHFEDAILSFGAISHPALTFKFKPTLIGTAVLDLRLAKIHWCHDEWFYSIGYKAKLNGVVDELIAPPDQNVKRKADINHST